MILPGKYLLFGRTGVGKSSLINTIAQAELASTNTTYICTRSIQPYAFDTPFGSYVLYDSPGFCDDDDPKTDENYFKAIVDFLQSSISAESEISILFVLRIDGTRVRSEDFDVVKYLARVLGKFDIPLTLVATWSDFRKGGDFVRSQLDRLRLQRLVMLDAAVLESSNCTMCASGFQGSFAVDNNTGVWLSSYHPISLRIDPLLQSSSAFEHLIGHSKEFIFSWIKTAGCDPEYLVNHSLTHLIDNRVLNLTGYPLTVYSDSFDFLAHGSLPQRLVRNTNYLRMHVGHSASEALDAVRPEMTSIIWVNYSLFASWLDSDLPARFNLAASLLFDQIGGYDFDDSMCCHLVSIYVARQLTLELYYTIASARAIGVISISGIQKRISVFVNIFIRLNKYMGDVYLSEELLAFITAAFIHPPSCSSDDMLCHFMNALSILHFASIFSEIVCFPRDLSHYPDNYIPLYLVDNILLSLLGMKFKFYLSSELIGRFFDREGYYKPDGLADFISSNPSCFLAFLVELAVSLKSNSLLVFNPKAARRLLLRYPEAEEHFVKSELEYDEGC